MSKPAATPPANDWLQAVRIRAARLRFGTIQIVVHDGRVTQIDTTERLRLDRGVDPEPAIPSARTEAPEL
jgi:hypothetical protein